MMELLSPAGDRQALIAALRNGADAVYLGGQTLNARRGAGNFDPDGLQWAADYCHERGKKVYVAVNTLVKQAELPLLMEIASQISRAGADAAIVQDLGAAAVLRRMLPELPLHASTQMAVHNRHGVRFLKETGFARVVLAREMRFDEIGDCAVEGLELEVFCHGALCVSCSGQCLFSSMVGGRSGNRGLCAQPCRLPYQLTGELVDASGYLLSPRDLMLLMHLDRLEAAGVRSLKIEGRLKRPEYVAVVTRIYREAISGAIRPGGAQVDALRQIYSRGGFTAGYGPGVVDAELICDERPNHAGLPVGECVRGGRVRLDRRVRAKDALVIGDTPVTLSGEAGAFVRLPARATPGEKLVRLADDEQLTQARQSYESAEAPTVAITGTAVIAVGQPVRLTVSDGESVIEQTGAEAARAEKAAADPTRVRAQLEKTGGTPYRFESLEIVLDPDAYVPVSALNALRRDALDALRAARIAARRGCGDRLLPLGEPKVQTDAPGKPRLSVQSGQLALLRKALSWGADEAVFQPDDITPEALDALAPDVPVRLALPMTCADRDLQALNRWALRHREWIAGVLIANPAHLALQWPGQLSTDFSMNVANDHTVAELQSRGVQIYTPSVELTAREIAGLRGCRELIVYGRLPLMQLRHCPLNARLGNCPHSGCARCDGKRAAIAGHALIDRKGVRFPFQRLKTQSGCVVRLLNSVPLMLLRHAGKLPPAGGWRVLLTNESEDVAEAAIRLHRMALDHQDYKGGAEWALIDRMDTTTGHYFRGVE